MPDFITYERCRLILEALGYHRHPTEDPWLFVSDGTIPGPKAVGVEPLLDDAEVSVEMFRYWLQETYIDADAIRRVLAEFLGAD